MTCVGCGAPLRDGAKFCSECGRRAVAACPSCGAQVSGGKFCSECGAALTDHSVGGLVAPEPVAERRVASLLFADLVGFTSIAEGRDPESVRELLAAYFDRARAIVGHYGGTVEKFIGDAVFAVWGVPAAREDDAERAVRAGLDLVATATVLGEELGVAGLQMRVGVTTGQVAVTLGAASGDRQGMVAGDAVNTAARIQSIAAPGEVWVDDTTRSLTTASLAYAPAGTHEVKGKTMPVELFRAVRTTAAVGGAQRVDGLEAPFVGRDRELRLVKELFHATAEDRRARLVMVAGEPGIGKSRLAWEFEKYADAITAKTHWLRGRCLSYGQGIAGRVVAEMVRSLLRVTESDDADAVLHALDERLQRHIQDHRERAVLRPRLTSLLGLSDAVYDQADLFACWRAFFESLCGDDSSVTLVVEDLQWADDGFLDFLDHLLDASRAPILVLALARPEISARRAGIGAGRRSSTVFLEPLPDAAMAKLLDGLVADLPVDLRAELVARAEGVPLYAVETVRALIDRDVVVALGGQYVVDPVAAGSFDLSQLGPPASLQALLAARLDALPAAERRVVQDASVLGLSFTRAGIAALAPSDIDLDAALESLRRKEILVVDNDPRSPERGHYRFVQALLRASAYDTLSRRDRHARHLAAAEHFGSAPDADSIAAVRAAHYLDALAAVPDSPDAQALQGQAAGLLEQAALQAAGVGAPSDALASYGRLLSLDLPDETTARVAIAASSLAIEGAENLEQSLRWVEVGSAAARRLGDEEALLRLTMTSARLTAMRAETAEAVAIAQDIFEASIDRPDRVGLLAAAARLISVCAPSTGDFELAHQVVFRALPAVERYGDEADFDLLLDGLGAWAIASGYRRFALVVHQGSPSRPDERDGRALVRKLNYTALLLPDDPVAVIQLTAATLRYSEEFGLVSSRVVATGHQAVALLAAGRWNEAEELLRRHYADGRTDRADWESYLSAAAAVLAYARADPALVAPAVMALTESTDAVVREWLLMREAVVTHFAGDVRAAAAVAADAVEGLVAISPTSEDVPLGYSLAVDMLLESGSLERLDALTTTLEDQVPLGQRFRMLHGQLLRARAHLSPDPAPGLRAAVEVFTTMAAAYAAAQARVELAAVLAAAGDRRGASDLLAAARPVLEEIGAAPRLAMADAVAARLPADGPLAGATAGEL